MKDPKAHELGKKDCREGNPIKLVGMSIDYYIGIDDQFKQDEKEKKESEVRQ